MVVVAVVYVIDAILFGSVARLYVDRFDTPYSCLHTPLYSGLVKVREMMLQTQHAVTSKQRSKYCFERNLLFWHLRDIEDYCESRADR